MKVLFFTQTTELGASARYRVYQFLSYLEKGGITCSVCPGITEGHFRKYLGSGGIFTKSQHYLSQFLKRITEIFKTRDYDVVFFQRDLIVHVYPFLEKVIALVNKNIIFDFDDAIYLYPPNKKAGMIFNLFWDRRKIERIIKLSKQVIVANNFLKRYTERFTKNVTVIPTSVNPQLYKPVNRLKQAGTKATIGWIGSQGTFGYLENIFPVFIELAKRYSIGLKIIGVNGPRIYGVDTCYREWNINTEIEDMHTFDIGIMPLTDDEWSRGKSGTKLLQYMAAGIPAVASPVGVNAEIIKDGINGLLANTKEEWVEKISMLIEDKQLRAKLVNNARSDVVMFYSIQANAPKLLRVFEQVILNNWRDD